MRFNATVNPKLGTNIALIRSPRISKGQEAKSRKKSGQQHGANVKKASEYRAHAEECRSLARTMQGEQRDQLLAMAANWEKLAADRSDLIRRYPDLALQGEHEEEASEVSNTAPHSQRLRGKL
jgi:ribosomal protein S4